MSTFCISYDDFCERAGLLAPAEFADLTDQSKDIVLTMAWEECAWIATLTNERLTRALERALQHSVAAVWRCVMKLHPFEQVRREVEHWIEAGAVIHQQFECAHCGVKQTMGEPNTLWVHGRCEECGGETDIVRDGCNFLAHFAGRMG
jgi:hypothetical protein